MKERKSSIFLFGFIIGVLGALLYWYWQKSTAAEDGALDLLDRLAAAEARLQELRAELTAALQKERPAETASATAVAEDVSAPVATEAKADVTMVHGIGPVFARRLQNAGIDTIEEVAATDMERLMEVLHISHRRASKILAEARNMID